MAPETSSKTKAMVVAWGAERLSHQKISDRLLEHGVLLHRKTVSKILKDEETKRNGWTKPPKRLSAQFLPSVRTKANIRKVKKAVLKKIPDSQRKLARKLGCSVGSVSKIVHENLGLKVRKKTNVHHLTDVQKKQRYERGKLFIQYLGPQKIKKIFTMDETWITLDDCNSEKEYYYTDNFLEIPKEWRKKPTKHWPKKIMVAIGISWQGMTKAYVVDGKAKVTAKYFIDKILSRMVKEDLPRLYGRAAKEVTVHFDSARSHAAKYTQNWMKVNHPRFVPEYHWMASSPDLAPLDYAINGILKKYLADRKATTISGLSKVIQDVCTNFDLRIIRNVHLHSLYFLLLQGVLALGN
ncbi:hypothetical protein RvY_08455 [Ramazzottius varieornatus]|uniref:Tc1-like transposase DDE domain-containing protein n=1 Tax=Ramazzottius varieornatus TaxID=947166 RepID=A0A1D1VAI3_RAMVA|nr:hypothetical protein RvY_08455 [Ramazzottius varieornatus]